MAAVALLFLIAKWLNHWFILFTDCLGSMSSDQPVDKVEPDKTPPFHMYSVLRKQRFNPTLQGKKGFTSFY